MFGKNPIRKAAHGDGCNLDVVSIFPTLQGEGPYAGWPAIFIRLGGCNLTCSFCDTDFETYQGMKLEEILAEISSKQTNQKLVVITGGEPFLQPINKLCEELIKLGYKVQIETNGTLFRDIPEAVEIICSPKAVSSIRPDLHERVTAYKFVISSSNPDYNHVPFETEKPIYVQPMNEYDVEKNMRNIEYTRDLALEKGYNLSLQLHKILGLE